jgi:hypothetical protein
MSMKTERAFSILKLVAQPDHNSVEDRHLSSLLHAYKRMELRSKLSKGIVVKWKRGLRNRKRPLDEEPAIVTRILKKPVTDPSENNSASQFFREPLDTVIGIWDDGEFNELYVDGRRLEPYE